MESSTLQDTFSLPRGARSAEAAQRARSRGSTLARMLAVGDLVSALVAASLAVLILSEPAGPGVAFVAGVALLWPAAAFSFGLYRGDSLTNWVSSVPEVPRGFVAMLTVSWPFLGLAALLGLDDPVALVLLVVPATAALGAVGRASIRAHLHRTNDFRQRTAVLGSGLVAGEIVKKLRENDQFGLDPIGLVDDSVHDIEADGMAWLGRFADLEDVIREHGVDRVIIAFSRASHEELLRSIRVCRDEGIAVDVVPRLFELLDGSPALGQVGGLPLLSVGTAHFSRSSLIAKRALDVAVSAIALALLSPLLLALAIAIRTDSKGPVFFRQARAGRGNRPFELIKFRSMYVDAEERKRELAHLNDVEDGVMFKIHDDPRITRVGRFIRRYSLDELPQLINVLKGDMSLVGPRPLIFDEASALEEPWHRRRLELRPGITGPWQVYGRSQNPFQEMVRFDYQYVAGWSLARDIEILLATLPVVLSGRGAY